MSFADNLAQLDAALNKPNWFTNTLGKIEAKTQVKRLYIFTGFVAFLTLWLIFGYGAGLVCTLIGFVYPAYQSIKAIESTNKDDDTQWLTYWVVFSAFSIVEFFSDIILYWFPLYWFIKCIFLVWCFAPVSWNGSHTIYHRFLRPQYLRHSNSIDNAISKAATSAKEIADQAQKLSGHGAKSD